MATVPRHLDLDFVAPALPRRLGRALLVAGLLAAAAGTAQFATTWVQWQQHRVALEALPPPAPRSAPPPSRAEAAGLRAAQGVTRELTAPWADLLDAIEAAATRDVVLVAIEPMVAQQTVRITADARSPDAMLDLVERLRRGALADVALVSHQVQAQKPGTPVRFQVQARWTARPANDRGGRP